MKYQPSMFCEHANECPTSICRCPVDCACRERMCPQYIGTGPSAQPEPTKKQAPAQEVLQMTSVVHELKCWMPFFEHIFLGRKTFEVRRNDRGFQAGDVLVLRETDPNIGGSATYTGRRIRCQITYVLSGENFGVKDGFAVLGFRILTSSEG